MTATSEANPLNEFFVLGDAIVEEVTQQTQQGRIFTDSEIADYRHKLSRCKIGPEYLQRLWDQQSAAQSPYFLNWLLSLDATLSHSLTSRLKISFEQIYPVSLQISQAEPEQLKYSEDAKSKWIGKTVQLLIQQLTAGHAGHIARLIHEFPGTDSDVARWCRLLVSSASKATGQISFSLSLGLFLRHLNGNNESTTLLDTVEELSGNCSMGDLKIEPNFGLITALDVLAREQFLGLVLPRLRNPHE
jgi:hypothetical protein